MNRDSNIVRTRKPSRILVVHNEYQQKGGEDRVVEDEIELLRNQGHEVRLFSKHNKSIDSTTALSLFLGTVWSRRVESEIRAEIASFEPDVMHVHNTFPLISPSIYWAAARANVPVVQTLHNFRLLCVQAMFLRNDQICEDCLGRLPWRGVVRQCYRNSMAQSATTTIMLGVHRAISTYREKVTRFIALSEFAKSKFIASKQLTADQLVVKPNFVDIAFKPTADARKGGVVVGRLSREKGLHVLVAALDKLKQADVEVIGTGPEQNALKNSAKITLLGWRAKDFITDRMRAARYLLLPSICYENFPRTLVEAFACGLPVIASRLGALPEIVQEGYNGLLFDPGSAEDLANKIEWADNHPQEMAEMGRNARITYENKYTAKQNYRQLIQIYDEALAAASRTPIPAVAQQQA